jgi:hypothetical protein
MQVAVNAGEALFSNFNTALVLKGENSSLYNAGLGYMFDERYT